MLCLLISHSRIQPFSETPVKVVPPDVKPSLLIAFLVGFSNSKRNRPAEGSHSTILRSSPADARSSLRGENETVVTRPRWPFNSKLPDAPLRRIDPSVLPAALMEPSLLQAMETI